MTRERPQHEVQNVHRLITVLLLALCCPWLASPANAGDIYGNILLRDYETEKERPVDRLVKLEVVTERQRVESTSRPGATYYMHVPQEGRFMLYLTYGARTLSVEIGSYYNPNRYDLVLLHRDDQYVLRVRPVREWRRRPQDKD